MKANGVEFVLRGNHGMTHSAYLADPDGHGIEVVYNVPSEAWEGDVDAALNYFEFLDARRPRGQHRLPALRRGDPRASGDPWTGQHPSGLPRPSP